MPAYEVCFCCSGSGLQDGMHGPVSCSNCQGDGTIMKRDDRGRFTVGMPQHPGMTREQRDAAVAAARAEEVRGG